MSWMPSARVRTVAAAAEDSPEGPEPGVTLARGLQRLASARSRYVYARMEDPECFAKGYASPCTGPAFPPNTMAYGACDPNQCAYMLESSYPLHDQVLRRDGYRCVVSGSWASRGPISRYVEAVRIFKHPLVVHKGVYDNDVARRDSVTLGLELLRRYCQLSDKHIDIHQPEGTSGTTQLLLPERRPGKTWWTRRRT
ncbi:hypothetical protein LXA43DRAFT_1101670 [Ganoderma leucocontextum]|nr:hypothetical protein LXA43DRAFT_1101670 [Ganoderma leucocontextum]